jgi:hypothetical protein
MVSISSMAALPPREREGEGERGRVRWCDHPYNLYSRNHSPVQVSSPHVLSHCQNASLSHNMFPILSSHEVGRGFLLLIIHGSQMTGQVEKFDFEPIFSRISGLLRIYIDLASMGSTPANNFKDVDEIY